MAVRQRSSRNQRRHVTTWATPAPTHGPSLLDASRGLGQPGGRQARAAPRRCCVDQRPAIDARRPERHLDGQRGRRTTGNVVVLVHSNSFPRFGSGIVVPEYDLAARQPRRPRLHARRVGHPNFPVAGRRPATTLHAWAVADVDGRPRFIGGTPGGANQMPWNAQTLARIVAGR